MNNVSKKKLGLKQTINTIKITTSHMTNNQKENKMENRTNTEVKGMALTIGTVGTETGWVEAKLLGFRLSQAGGNIIGIFVLNNGDFASWLTNNPMKTKDYNDFLKALGKPTIVDGSEIVLPEKDDDDKLGLDAPVMAFVKTDKTGQYLNITGFKLANLSRVPF